MDPDKAARNLQVIRQLMERPVRYSTQSGMSAVLAGCVALTGTWANAFLVGRGRPGPLVVGMGLWGCVFLISLAGTLGLTRLREIRQGMPFWTPAKRKLLLTVLGPFVACVGLTVAIVCNTVLTGSFAQCGLMFPCWMLFYGVACWQVSQYSTREIGILGAAFIVAGLASAAFLQEYPYWTMSATFGGYHIVYGIYAWIRYGG